MNRLKIAITALVVLFSSASLNAQSLKDLFSSKDNGGGVSDVVTSVTGGLTISADKIVGQWDYVKPAVELSSESLASKAAGSLVATQVENKLAGYCEKIGIKPGSFTFVFNEDKTFTSNIGKRNLSGTYIVNPEEGTITLKYGKLMLNIGSLTSSATLTSNSLSLLFNADKLLKLFAALGSATGNQELKMLSSLTEQYDGLKIGYELSGKAVETPADTTEKVGNAIDAISKWF